MRSQDDIAEAIDAHGASVWRACVLYFHASPDAQDAFQETYLKYALSDASFNDAEHCKAWLLRVAANVCKDMLRSAHRRNVPLEEGGIAHCAASSDASTQPDSSLGEVIDAMHSLDDPPRTPLYLSLYEGYSAPEIASMLDAPVNTVYSWISRGKKQLKEVLS